MSEIVVPPRWFIASFAAAVLIVVGWRVSHLYSSPSSPGCLELYAKAQTSEDTLAVDRRTPEHDPLASGATTCVQVRMNARGSQAPSGAQLLLTRAIEATGGEAALAGLTALEWSGSATIHTPGKEIEILGTWQVGPLDTARVTTWLAEADSTKARAMVVAGDKGWLLHDGRTDPMPADQLAEERHQFYLYSLLRLLPLRDSGVTLTPLPADSAGESGIVVHRAGRLDVALYFERYGGVTRMHTKFAALPGSPSADEEVTLEGTVEVAGVQWFRQMHIYKDGKPYFDLVVIAGRPAVTRPASWIPASTH